MTELRELSEKGAEILRPLPHDMSWQHTIEYIEGLLNDIEANLDPGNDTGDVEIRSRVEKAQIILYRDAVRRLQSALLANNITVSPEGVLSLIDTLLSGETIAFEGEPLEGLQVMGMLETRAIDFDHIIIPSLNDKILPARSRKRTFIPDSLRHGYGMVSAFHQETLMSYYFYRLLARAKSVTLIYDARAGEGMRSGGRSRFLHQLEHLYAKNRIHKSSYRFMLFDNQNTPKPIHKSDSIMEMLRRFTVAGSKSNFSATSLKKYMACGIRFYYEEVRNINTQNRVSEYMDAATQGTILHDTMLNLYFPPGAQRILLSRPVNIDAGYINSILSDPEKIKNQLRRSINRHYFNRKDEDLDKPVTGTAQITAEMLYGDVLKVLKYDLKIVPFKLYGGEVSNIISWHVDGVGDINMKFAIDRVDCVNDSPVWRIVDYKTGGSHVDATSFDNIFNADRDAANIFQLMLYANLLNRTLPENKVFSPMIYSVNELNMKGPISPVVEKGNITEHIMINDRFVEALNNMLAEIFNRDEPFRPAESDDACTYCTLQQLCGKLG